MSISPSVVAVTGVSCKFPGSNDLGGLWKTLNTHDSLIRPVALGKGKKSPFGFASLLEDKERNGFDPAFWGLTPAQVSRVQVKKCASICVFAQAKVKHGVD